MISDRFSYKIINFLDARSPRISDISISRKKEFCVGTLWGIGHHLLLYE
jgi:hypothetical protein